MKNSAELSASQPKTSVARVGRAPAPFLATLWLGAISVSIALATTVLLFDRTTLGGVNRLWLGSLALGSAAIFTWWTRPRMVGGRLHLGRYDPTSLLWATAPVALLCLALVAADYLSDGVHAYLYDRFYYRDLLSDRSWPVMPMAALVLGYVLAWTARESLLEIGAGSSTESGITRALSRVSSLLPIGLLALGLLLSAAALSTINVNFWRYWATADGWAVTGHYPVTITDILHIEQGHVARYFISYPLLPSILTLSFAWPGHNTLGAHLPMIAAGALLPLAVFLATREITGHTVLAFLCACLVATFPLLRRYTMDVAEADGLLMTALVLAAYFNARSSSLRASGRAQALAGVFAGIASLARPEGVLYMGAMYLAAVKERWREGRFWLSASTCGLVIAGFSAVTLKEFGMIWPSDHSATLQLSNALGTLETVRQSRLFWMYASALGVSEAVLAAIVVAILAAAIYSTVRMVRKDFALVYMPVAALGNIVMVFFVGPIPAEAGKFHDFFRHISYGFPLLAITLAYGLNHTLKSMQGRWDRPLKIGAAGAFAALALAFLSLLEGPVTPGTPAATPVMTSDVHVTATELLLDPYPLPVMRFRQADSRHIPDADEYMAVFPDDVGQHYASADVRLVGNSVDYYRAAKLIFIGFLVVSAAPLLMGRGRLSD